MSKVNYDAGAPATGRKVMLATTCYDRPEAGYVFAMSSSREALHGEKIPTAYLLLQGNCHVDDARNEVVHTFLQSDCTELVFLDADVSWAPEDLVRLCRHDVDLVGGVYPYRREGDESMPVRLLSTNPQPEDGLIEVEGLPTGFMRIRRHVLKALAAQSQAYPSATGDVAIVFERTLVNGTRWGGDLNFCNRWRANGGSIHADYELRLGHAAKVVVHDSLGALLRRRAGSTLAHVAGRVRDGTYTTHDLVEAIRFADNRWGAQADVLATVVALARGVKGPIIETGSGLTTVLMAAAAPEQTVYCLEHSKVYAELLKEMVDKAGVTNIGLCLCPIKDGWYDLADMDIPHHYALGLNDGPPRLVGSRLPMFNAFDIDTMVCDDADDMAYRKQIVALARGRKVDFVEPRAAIISKEPLRRVA